MRPTYKFSAIAAIALALSGCLGQGDETIILNPQIDAPATDDIARVVSTEQSVSFNHAGYTLNVPKGSVPTNSQGESGRVSFSITQASELPKSLPDYVTAVNSTSAIKVEPMGFIFNSPLTIELPTRGKDLNKVALFQFNEETETWNNLPFSSISSDGTASVSVMKLGYFVLVEYEQMHGFGGIHIAAPQLDDNYYYYITVYSRDTSNQIKTLAISHKGKDIYVSNVPIGRYNLHIAREYKSSFFDMPQSIEYWSGTLDVNVRSRLVSTSESYDTWQGWTNVNIDNMQWVQGRPSNDWGNPTVTYGTGVYQATLTWVNSYGSETDYDLHLFGPEDLHVYFSNKNQGAFELDRDWVSDLGNAVENSYSISDDYVKGEYVVKVHHYGGVLGKRYYCRVIANGVVIKSTSGSISTRKAYDEICTFTLN